MNSIKFNQQGIEAILNSSKTMTRRPMATPPRDFTEHERLHLPKMAKYKVGETVFVTEAELRPYMKEDIFLKITNIKVERLQDISEEDCVKEGIDKYIGLTMLPQEYFEEFIWNNLPYKAPYDWNSNPYVFVYEFEIIE